MDLNATLTWTQKMQFVAQAEHAPALVIDSPEGGTGPSPMQLVLIGVAGCTAMDVVSILKKKRAPVTGVTVNISGQRAKDHPKRFTHLDVEFVVHGQDVKPQAVERAIELSAAKYCGAIASINATIAHAFRIEA